MTSLTFTLRGEPDQRLDLTALAPDRLLGRSAAEVEKIEIGTTKQSVKVGDAFKLTLGDVHDVRYEGGSTRLDCLGAKLLPGFAITVNGDVGAQLGRLAKAGTITVNGNAGPYAASGNAGANIEIKRNAGDFLCGPLAGELAGMAGGRVVVRGNAGARAGDRLRRGVVIIEGDAGEELGARLIAGTIFLLGKPAGRVGYLNKRGTIALAKAGDFGPTYIDCGPQDLTFARMYARSLREVSAGASLLFSGKLRRFGGDTSVYGKGEILTPV